MPPEEISYWPSRAKQTIFLAVLCLVFLASAGGFVLIWSIDPDQIQDFAWRRILLSTHVLLLVLCAFFAVFSAVCTPILLVMMLMPAPVLVLTPDGIRLRGNVLVRWEEIDEIHEYVHRVGFQQILVGLYFRDEEAIRARLSYAANWQMNQNKKQGLPPIVIATQHLHESTEEILDDIEAYLEKLRTQPGKRRRLPTVYRRKE